MANTYKVLAQSNPSATTATTLYTVPSSTSAVISTITICNYNATTNANYSILVRPAGETVNVKHYINSNNVVQYLDTIALTLGITLGNTDVITVYTTGSNVSFGVFGSEIT